MRAVNFYQLNTVTNTNTTPSSANALYTDLSGYYDLMCSDINYQAQSQHVQRLHQFFGNGGKQHLDLACGTGPHVRYFIDNGYQSSGLDINQPMLDIAQQRCPEAYFMLGDMTKFSLSEPVDIISCFLYSLHYCADLAKLQDCFASVHRALKLDGIFCFNAVNKDLIDNKVFERHTAEQDNSHFVFTSAWHYPGTGDKQSLLLSIEKTSSLNNQETNQQAPQQTSQTWQDHHPMVALNFEQLRQLLSPYFEVQMFEHDYDKIIPWNQTSGNAIFVCVKK
ncbi:class I SAM-dependent DNA methyltransferase [Paraglaciecola hydrolytica]|uniref:SAM-dependent methyltransferase n=1 Tax=Paraglaciecola hydrolytica TaxID=1799789 RepID=A0A148KNB0_9ALTE|nr:class I SAM-dependent methyltransferase [Paraglaciecola hydrolytica]KXI27787.1 SAM-dependent methyltransferase [Paraglaciecola hydrolytica]